jgi:geranylgeranyl pyrophosphate synthase
MLFAEHIDAHETLPQIGLHPAMEFADVIHDLRLDLNAVENRLRTAADIDFPVLGDIIDTLIGAGGKRLRPIMLLLSAKPFNYELTELVSAAAGIELLHTASLVHDDTIDRSQLRRGTPTLNSMFDTGTVIMLGDYLFARSAMLAAETMNPRVVAVFASTLGHICDGQLHEILTAHDLQQTREDYERRIFGKTASLFAGAAEMGAIIAGASDPEIQAMREFGTNVGMAFQIVDDVLDLRGSTEEIGKPAGLDLKQGTVTLPTMIFMAQADGSSTATEVKRIVNSGDASDDDLKSVAATIRASGALDEALASAHGFVERAKERISFISDNQTVEALHAIADSSLERTS